MYLFININCRFHVHIFIDRYKAVGWCTTYTSTVAPLQNFQKVLYHLIVLHQYLCQSGVSCKKKFETISLVGSVKLMLT